MTRRWPSPCEERLKARFGDDLLAASGPPDRAGLRRALNQTDVLLASIGDPLDATVLDATPLRTRFIGSFGVGIDHIDLDLARARGIVVSNTPDISSDCTADLTLALLLMVARRVREGERYIRDGHWRGWQPTELLGSRVNGSTLGLIGFGRIARAVARRAHHGFGMKVIFHNRSPMDSMVASSLGASPRDSVDAVLAEADMVSLHCAGAPELRHLIDARRLALMRPGAILINTARGCLVDENALARALRTGGLGGAGLDVHAREPYLHPGLTALPNVVLLPHMGSAVADTRIAMGMRVIDNLEAFLAGREPPDRVV